MPVCVCLCVCARARVCVCVTTVLAHAPSHPQAAKKEAKTNRKAKEEVEREIGEWAERVASDKVTE